MKAVSLTNQQWRVLFGAINAACAFLLIQPEIKTLPVLAIILGTVVSVLGFLRAPADVPPMVADDIRPDDGG